MNKQLTKRLPDAIKSHNAYEMRVFFAQNPDHIENMCLAESEKAPLPLGGIFPDPDMTSLNELVIAISEHIIANDLAECLEILLDNGVDENTCLRSNELYGINGENVSLVNAAAAMDSERCLELLIRRGADINNVNTLYTGFISYVIGSTQLLEKCSMPDPLLTAIANGSYGCYKLLLENGARFDPERFFSVLAVTECKSPEILEDIRATVKINDKDFFNYYFRSAELKKLSDIQDCPDLGTVCYGYSGIDFLPTRNDLFAFQILRSETLMNFLANNKYLSKKLVNYIFEGLPSSVNTADHVNSITGADLQTNIASALETFAERGLLDKLSHRNRCRLVQSLSLLNITNGRLSELIEECKSNGIKVTKKEENLVCGRGIVIGMI